MNQVIAMHGWAGVSSIWRFWRKNFKMIGWDWMEGQRGYDGKKIFNSFTWRENSVRRVVIAHSLGLHLISNEIIKNATHIIMLASFGRFIPLGSIGRPQRASLDSMRESLGGRSAISMLRIFLERAAFPHKLSALPPHPLLKNLTEAGQKRLLNDLEILISTTGLPSGFPKQSKVIVFQGDQDKIISPATFQLLTDSLSKGINTPFTYYPLKGSGHSLITKETFFKSYKWIYEEL